MKKKSSSKADRVFKDPDVQRAYEKLRDTVIKNNIDIKKLFL